MTEAPLIDLGAWPGFERRAIAGPAGQLSVRLGGPAEGPAVVLGHSILSGSAVWRRQAGLLAAKGFRVIALDTRGHGESQAAPPPYAMDDLVGDVIAALDDLGLERAHYAGVSLGGMTGFGLGVRHPDRVRSLCIVAARADAPPPFAAAWDDRIALVRSHGDVEALVRPTAERWFGAEFLTANPGVADALYACIVQTSAEGFIGCAQAIQGLNYIDGVGEIAAPVSLVIGARDALLLQPMRDLQSLIPGAELIEIADAGHLPQVDQPDAFEQALLGHLQRAGGLA